MTLIIITGEKVEDKCINEPRHPFLAIQQAKELIDNILKSQKQEVVQKYSNSSDVVSCLYYYGSSKGISVRIYQNDLNHEITIDQAFEDWNRTFTFLDNILDE